MPKKSYMDAVMKVSDEKKEEMAKKPMKVSKSKSAKKGKGAKKKSKAC